MSLDSRVNKLENKVGGKGIAYIVEANGYKNDEVGELLFSSYGITVQPEDRLINVPKLCPLPEDKVSFKLFSANPMPRSRRDL